MENLTVIVPFRDGHDTIDRLLDSLPDVPVIVVDDQSREPYQTNRTNVKVVRLEQRGYFAGAVNRGIKECDTDVLVLNQDVWFDGDGWQSIVYANESYGILGHGVFGHPAWPNGYVQGTFMLLRRQALDRVGLLNEKDYPLWGCTCELQLRMCRAGYQAIPFVELNGMRHERGEKPYGSSIAQALQEQPDKQKWFIRTPPMVSVIITSHNYGQFLPDALASLMGGDTILGPMPGQTFQSFEVVIVDYGSDDAMECKQYDDPWKGIHVIRTEDKGTAAACNAGIKAAHGKFITCLDADDLMEPDRLEVLYRTALEFPHSFIYDDLRVVHANPRQPWKRTEIWEMPMYDFRLTLEKNGAHKGIFYPKAAWEDAGGYPEIFDNGREDWAFNIALGIRGWCGAHVPQPLYLYRRGDHNRTRVNTAPKFRSEYVAKLQSLFGKYYAGEQAMCDCGNRHTSVRVNTERTFKLKGLIGSSGLTLLEYTLPDRMKERAFQGSATQQYYYFGKEHPQNWVDSRDVAGFVEFMGGRAFKVVKEV